MNMKIKKEHFGNPMVFQYRNLRLMRKKCYEGNHSAVSSQQLNARAILELGSLVLFISSPHLWDVVYFLLVLVRKYTEGERKVWIRPLGKL